MSSDALTKIISAIAGGILIALQGINYHDTQKVEKAQKSIEVEVEQTKEIMLRELTEIEKRQAAATEEILKIMKEKRQ